MSAARKAPAEKPDKKAGKPDKKAGKPDKKAGKPDKKAGKSEEKAGKSEKKAGKPEKKARDSRGKPAPVPTPRLLARYQKEILPALAEELGHKNPLSLPRLQKIVVNMGAGSAVQDKKHLEEAVDALRMLSGQRPIVTNARKSIAGFRLREGMSIGCKVTLRGRRMYEFLDRLISLALPRVRDFRGLSPRAFDGQGNYTLGLTEQLVFPELNPDKYNKTQGMNVTLVTSSSDDDEARLLLRKLGMPLRTE